MRRLGTTVAFIVLSLLTLGAGAAAAVFPLVANWDQYFSVQPDPAAGGRATGTIQNVSGFGATRIRLLVDALDGAGQSVDQRVVWLGVDLPAGAQAHFAAPVPAAASYRVRVFAFELELTGGPR